MANNFSAATLHPAGCAFGDDNSVTKHSMMKGPRDSNICRTDLMFMQRYPGAPLRFV